MVKYLGYNVKRYVDSIMEVKSVILDAVLGRYKKCKKYSLNIDVSDYICYIDKKPFYIAPSISDVKTNIKTSSLNPKFMLFSAPGATGKSALAKYIANKFDAVYWDLAKVKIGINSFAGSILKTVGPSKYSEFVADMNTGEVLLVIDALDEAEIISGRKMINSFIVEINDSLNNPEMATVFLLARTETAQYIASFCAENNISVVHYEIGFFGEEASKDFIVKSICEDNIPTIPDISCVNAYYDAIKRNITQDECASFLGYAPVLQAIAKHIKETPNRSKMISELTDQKDCVSIIMKIMEDLLMREQTEKVIPAFMERCKEAYPEFTEWERVYSKEEQMSRLIHYILFSDISYINYPLDFLPPQLVDDYQIILESFLSQHPFVRTNHETAMSGKRADFTGPAFRDYLLARMILDQDSEILANMYFEESQCQTYFPSQIFFDCYMRISDNMIQPSHISYVYDSFRAKTTAYETAYLQCFETADDENGVDFGVIFGMLANKSHANKRDDLFASISSGDSPLLFNQLVNVSIDAPNKIVIIGQNGVDARIFNSSVVCDTIKWGTKNIVIESYLPEGCMLVARQGFIGDAVTIDVINHENLKISSPNLSSFFKLLPYNYDFEDVSDFDITRFVHALRCVLVEFRTHKKDTLAKTAERIENVTVGGSVIKRQVLDYLKYCGIIYSSAHLYKINETIMQEKGINYNALARMDTQQIQSAFIDFSNWLRNKC